MKSQYSIGIFVNTDSSSALSKSIVLLLNSIEKMGHIPVIIRPAEIDIINDGRETVLLNKDRELLPHIDCFINRHDISKAQPHDFQVAQELEDKGIPAVNNMKCSINVNDKFYLNQFLIKRGIKFPATASLSTKNNLKLVIKKLGGYPIVLKSKTSNQGKGVTIVKDHISLRSLVDLIWNSNTDQEYFLQKYISEARKNCYRSIVVGNKVVTSFSRLSPPGEFRASMHLGGFGGFENLSIIEQRLMIQITKMLQLDIVGFDFARTLNGEIIFIEVNAYPGIWRLQEETGLDLSPKFIELALKKIKKKQK